MNSSKEAAKRILAKNRTGSYEDWVSNVERGLKEYAQQQAIGFGEFLSDVRNEEGEIYINNNSYGIKPGYYTKAELYKKFQKQVE